ncbi:branched-chain amino acid transport system II carrier protein [Metabacillus sediminilitoris]|uniref:Branched-chain amino acid transport system carrier protein n=1 Tax=Metabacillus sediminilitoris TaxID=2567941 RepID=A0A4S4BSZ0_9BACI|nr:branched-chain amino acid transport system II carrier protein [Metabacillus sediminilitoris]QGQ44186.1 branched-chain amino acid transport system II carrier protein [Metabacillus sediminilitoris]THF78150.1 branched-chain amino acid transport system II carrier protein [Metabacillus sediminilitoris]
MSKNLPFSFLIVVGFMLFALFFGAGNLIFPALLGQSAGSNVWAANAGFLVTGAGLPLLGILALGISGKDDLQSLASRAHPTFGLLFTIVLYLSIGPLFAIPRTGTVSFEIAIRPFLGEQVSFLGLLIFTIIFFAITCFISINPSKMVDIIGKWLTPIMLLFIAILIAFVLFNPMGDFQAPADAYSTHAFFKGFQEGYLTMDALAAFVFGIIVINAIRDKGVTDKKKLLMICTKAALIAAGLLALIYTGLSYLGALSVEDLGYLDNGGQVLTEVSTFYFGPFGGVILGLIVLLACLTTSVGLITACSTYFHKLIPSISYRNFAIIFSVISTIFANFGLSQLISLSVPVLTAIYPLAIVLIALTFTHSLFKGQAAVYQGSLLLTFIVSLFDGLNAAGIEIVGVNQLFAQFLPFYEIGLGWIAPAVIGGILGFIINRIRTEPVLKEANS